MTLSTRSVADAAVDMLIARPTSMYVSFPIILAFVDFNLGCV